MKRLKSSIRDKDAFIARLLLAEVLAKRGQGPLQRPEPVHYRRRPHDRPQES